MLATSTPAPLPRPPSSLRRLLLVAAAVAAAACARGEAPADPPVDRETFIATYVDLRVAALTSDEGELGDSARAAVLARHGVSEDDLLEFAEVVGDDPWAMREIWDEVEARLDAARGASATPKR